MRGAASHQRAKGGPWVAGLAGLAALFAACAAPPREDLPEEVATRVVDLRPWTEQGFLFTPGAYAGPHEALGLVRVELRPGASWARRIVRTSDGVIRERTGWRVEALSAERALAELHAACVALGADGLTHLELRPGERSRRRGSVRNLTTGSLVAEGFAIRRRDGPEGEGGVADGPEPGPAARP